VVDNKVNSEVIYSQSIMKRGNKRQRKGLKKKTTYRKNTLKQKRNSNETPIISMEIFSTLLKKI